MCTVSEPGSRYPPPTLSPPQCPGLRAEIVQQLQLSLHGGNVWETATLSEEAYCPELFAACEEHLLKPGRLVEALESPHFPAAVAGAAGGEGGGGGAALAAKGGPALRLLRSAVAKVSGK
jgi:hypothetical protein